MAADAQYSFPILQNHDLSRRRGPFSDMLTPDKTTNAYQYMSPASSIVSPFRKKRPRSVVKSNGKKWASQKETFFQPGRIGLATLPGSLPPNLHACIELATEKATGAQQIDFTSCLDRLKQRLRDHPFPRIKPKNAIFPPLFPEYSMHLLHLKAGYLNQVKIQRENKLQRFEKKHNYLVQLRHFLAWVRAVRILHVSKVFLRKKRSMCAQETFVMWKTYAAQSRKINRYRFAIFRVRLQSLRTKQEFFEKRRLFDAWRHYTFLGRKQKDEGKKIFFKHIHRSLHYCFKVLAFVSRESKRERNSVRKAIMFMKKRKLVLGFRALIEAMEARKLMKSFIKKMCSQYEQKGVLRAMNGWKYYNRSTSLKSRRTTSKYCLLL